MDRGNMGNHKFISKLAPAFSHLFMEIPHSSPKTTGVACLLVSPTMILKPVFSVVEIKVNGS